MNVLVLTDHKKHNSSNSFYGITNALVKHRKIDKVFVCSRSDKRNDAFFNGERSASMYILEVDEKIDVKTFKSKILNAKKHLPMAINTILFRLPRPVHPNFFKSIKGRFKNCAVINNIESIEALSDKSFLMQLDQYVPPVKLCLNWQDIEAFYARFAIVLKPLKNYGGKGIIKLQKGIAYFGHQKQMSLDDFQEWYELNKQPYLAMKYMPLIEEGDKRIVVVNGKPLGALIRKPKDGGWMCNAAQGGISEISSLDKRDRAIVEYLNPIFKKHKVFMYGIDLLTNSVGKRMISEINTLSIGGLQPLYSFGQKNVFKQYSNELIKFLEDEYGNS